jgi:hypothetical protein
VAASTLHLTPQLIAFEKNEPNVTANTRTPLSHERRESVLEISIMYRTHEDIFLADLGSLSITQPLSSPTNGGEEVAPVEVWRVCFREYV